MKTEIKNFLVTDTYDVESGEYEVLGAKYPSGKGMMYPCKRIGSTTIIGLHETFVETRIK